MTATMEEKVVRRVRTPAGVRRFGQPIGSVIVRDGVLNRLTDMITDYPGWAKYQGADGKRYYVGKSRNKWVATDENDYEVVRGIDEDDVTKKLNDLIKPRLGHRGVVVRKATRAQLQAIRAKKQKPVIAPAKPREVLAHIRKSKSEYPGYEKFRGVDGEDYYVYKNEKTSKWYATDADDRKLFGRWFSYDRNEVLRELDAYAATSKKERGIAARRRAAGNTVDHATLAQVAYNALPNISDTVQIMKNGKKTTAKGEVIAKGWAVAKDSTGYPFIKIKRQNAKKTEEYLYPVGNPADPKRIDEFVVVAKGAGPPKMAPNKPVQSSPVTQPVPKPPVAPVKPPVPRPADRGTLKAQEWFKDTSGSVWTQWSDGSTTVGSQNVSEMGYEQARSKARQLDGTTINGSPYIRAMSVGAVGRFIILQTAPLNGFNNTVKHSEDREAKITASIESMSKADLKKLQGDLKSVLSRAGAREKAVIRQYLARVTDAIAKG